MKLLMVINKDKFNRYQFINIEDKTKIDLVLELYTDKGSFLLNEKDAPVDKGKDVFEDLYKKRLRYK